MDIRCAQGLGMHLKNVTANMGESETLHGIYVWYALVSTERVLSIMLGRPCMVNDDDCSAPIPLPIRKDERQATVAFKKESSKTAASLMPKSRSASSSSSKPSDWPMHERYHETDDQSISTLYFFHYLELSSLTQKAMAALYNPHIRHSKWVRTIRSSQVFLVIS